MLQSHRVLGRDVNTGGGGCAEVPPKGSLGDKNMGGSQENETELRLSLVFELAPDAVTFSFLAALKTEERRKRRL